MAYINCNVSGEIEPRVPRHPTAAPTETTPTVPEVSLAFDTPQQRGTFSNKPRSSPLPTSYAQWKQQVPPQPSSSPKIDDGKVQRIFRSSSSPGAPSSSSLGALRGANTALAIAERPQRLPPGPFQRDSRLKFYQKVGPECSPSENKILPTSNPMISPSRRPASSLSLAPRPQGPSDLIAKEKIQSSPPQEKLDRVKSPCDCHSHQSDNNEIINKLLSLVQSQNAQIQMLQGQVETLLSMRTERPRDFDYQRLPFPPHVSPTISDPAVQNPRLQYPKSPRDLQDFEEKQREDKCKQLIKEKKVSIGVMTSFELTVQDAVVYNVDAVPTAPDYQEPPPLGKTLGSRTPGATAVAKGPLEQIIEDSESHMSSTVQASNNFHTYSSARKSLQGNLQGESCVEPPQIHQRTPAVIQSQPSRLTTEPPRYQQPEGVQRDHQKLSSGGSHIPSQKNSPAPPAVLAANIRDDPPPEVVTKTPKVGWTLYDNVMCQVNEILHNTQDGPGDEGQEIVQETSGSKLRLNGIQQSTMEQLKLFGFTFADTSGCSEGRSMVDGRRMNPISIDASYYPRLDYQANVIQTSGSVSDSNTSLHMKALAMKYLGTKQLPNVSSHQRGMELFTSMVLSNLQNNLPGGHGNDAPQFDNNPRFQGSPKALPDFQGRSRNIGLRTGTSPFMRFYMSEDFPNTGPGRYDVPGAFKAVTSKPCVKSFSLKGYGGLGRFAVSIAHTEDYPAPCEYNVPLFPDKVKESKVPFGSTAKRKGFDTNRNPGPGLYRNITPLTRRIIFDHSFGGRVNLRLGVEIKCCKRNTDTCGICEENPIGDYWHLNNRMYLCRGCMTVERQRPRKHTKKELSNFRKIRDCSMIHSHEGTDAKIWLMHPGVIQKWSQKEAYLSSYFKD